MKMFYYLKFNVFDAVSVSKRIINISFYCNLALQTPGKLLPEPPLLLHLAGHRKVFLNRFRKQFIVKNHLLQEGIHRTSIESD